MVCYIHQLKIWTLFSADNKLKTILMQMFGGQSALREWTGEWYSLKDNKRFTPYFLNIMSQRYYLSWFIYDWFRSSLTHHSGLLNEQLITLTTLTVTTDQTPPSTRFEMHQSVVGTTGNYIKVPLGKSTLSCFDWACVSANGSDVYFEVERSLPKCAWNCEKWR